ncbi:alanine racemase, partial [Streptomyces sp. NPDC004976]
MNETVAPGGAELRARAEIDLAAVRANVRVLRERAPGAALMAVVKADRPPRELRGQARSMKCLS